MQKYKFLSLDDEKKIADLSICTDNALLCARHNIGHDQLLSILDKHKDIIKNKREKYIKNVNETMCCALDEALEAFALYIDAKSDYEKSREKTSLPNGDESIYTVKNTNVSLKDIVLMRNEIEDRRMLYKQKASSYINSSGEENAPSRKIILQEGINTMKEYKNIMESFKEII